MCPNFPFSHAAAVNTIDVALFNYAMFSIQTHIIIVYLKEGPRDEETLTEMYIKTDVKR